MHDVEMEMGRMLSMWAGHRPAESAGGRGRGRDGVQRDRQVPSQAKGRVGEGWLCNWTSSCFREERRGRERQRLTQVEEIGART